jgi:hypothetical protein
VLRRLALHSLAELETEGPALVSVLGQLIGRRSPRRSTSAPRQPWAPRAPRAEEVRVTRVRRSGGR